MKKKRSLLKQQRLLRRSLLRGFFSFRFLKAALLISVVGAGVFYIYQNGFLRASLQFLSKKVDPRGSLLAIEPNWTYAASITDANSNRNAHALSDAEHLLIKKFLKKNMSDGTHQELTNLANLIYQNSEFDAVRVYKVAENRLELRLSRRQAFMLIEADAWRLLTENGTIYGRASTSSVEEGHFVRLNGIFKNPRSLVRNSSNNFLDVDPEDRGRIMNAIELYKNLTKRNIMIEDIIFDHYRGFSIRLKEPQTEVVLGFGEFDHKLVRMEKIMARLAKDAKYASKIELDFEGKAFIKEAPLPQRG
ncbi:MAG: hypothetical protein KBD78_04590 [Oligoflexales bacterium]|nr:hypothetical protein [Oligoflexales bacterium]